jgi:predicted Fe-Mo cluster-binding NifX family protein
MKICVPTNDEGGLQAEVCGHFGSAPFFTLVETESGDVEVVENVGEGERTHGGCSPLGRLRSHSIDLMVCQGIGRGALMGLQERGIRVLVSDSEEEQRVQYILVALRDGRLEEASTRNACQGGAHHRNRGSSCRRH